MRHAISRNLLLSGAVVAAVLACRSRGAREPSAAPGGASDASVPPAAGQHSPEQRTRVSEALDTMGCSFVARQLHPQPRELVDEFLRRDADGEFVSPGDWYFSALMCGGRGGTDRATLITSYRLDSLRVGPDTAIYRVRYAVQGSLDQDANGFFIGSAPSQMEDTFVVLRTSFGWRIAAPLYAEPRLLPEAAHRRLPFSQARDSAILDSLSRLTRRARA